MYSEYGKAWYEKNREPLKEVRRKYRENNRDYEIERHRVYREQNREKIREKDKKYYKQNKDKFYRRGYKRRAKKAKNHFAPYTQVELCQRFEKFNNECAYCGKKGKLGVDHFVAIAHGGPDCLNNVVPSCSWCNSSKRDRDALIWYKSQEFYSASRWRNILKVLGKTEASLGQLPLF